MEHHKDSNLSLSLSLSPVSQQPSLSLTHSLSRSFISLSLAIGDRPARQPVVIESGWPSQHIRLIQLIPDRDRTTSLSNSIRPISKTEDAKERALEKLSINVCGKQLLIFRIDAPRTTVVRISNLYSAEAKKKLFSICRSYGKVKVVGFRHKEIRDVHFMLSEWPNMLKILNRLNGLKVDDCRIIAQPALVFPPEVLRVLWSHPDERQRLETTIWMKTLLCTRLQKVHCWILYAMPMNFFLTVI